jgi:hypothetical protein
MLTFYFNSDIYLLNYLIKYIYFIKMSIKTLFYYDLNLFLLHFDISLELYYLLRHYKFNKFIFKEK